MPATALDIGSYSIKAIAGSPGQKIKVKTVAEAFNTIGVAVPTDEGMVDKMIKLLDAVFTEHKLPTNDVRLALPETVVSTKVIAIPSLTDAELASAISWQAEQHIPIPPDDLALEYEVLERPPKNSNLPMKVLLVGVRKQVVQKYVDMLNSLGIEPTIIESQMLAIIRSLGFEPADPPTLVAHIGASSMHVAVVNNLIPEVIFGHLSGGFLLNKALQQTLGLDSAQAEQYKVSFGLDPAQFEGKVVSALTPTVNLLVGEIRKTQQFYNGANPQTPIKRVVLTGGTAVLKNFVQYIAQQLGLEVMVASPFATASGSIPETINQPGMAVCMGLLGRD